MAELIIKRKDQITDIAQNLFRERGYAATSMRDLAKAVGIEPASLYSHIKSKEEILSGICHRIADEFLEGMQKLEAQDKQPVEQFRAAVLAHVKVIARNMDASGVFFNEWRHLSGDDLAMFKHKRAQYEEYFRNILRKGIEEGVFRDTDIHFTARVIFSAMNGMHEWYNPNGKLSPLGICNKICDLVLSGLYKEIDNSSL